MRFCSLQAICLTLILTLVNQYTVSAQGDIFTVEIGVSGQNSREFSSATKIGLAAVIERAAGNRAVLQRPEVKEALGQAESMVEQFSYLQVAENNTVLNSHATPSVRKSKIASYVLQVRYSPETIGELLGQNIGSVQQNRAHEGSTMMWLVFEENGQSQIVGGEIQSDVRNRITDAGTKQGLTLVFPLLDLQDLQALGVADIRAGFSDRITAASARYETDSILSVVVKKQHEDLWLSNWRNISLEGNKNFTTTASNLDSVADSAMEWVAQLNRQDNVDSQSSVLNGSSETQIWVAYVDTTDKYTRVSGLLQSMSSVEIVNPSYLSAQGMMFSISPRISLKQLKQRLGNIPWLQQTARPDVGPDGNRIPDNAELFFDYSG